MIYEFTPKQDLHGYSKPWAPGEGINKYSYYNLYEGYWGSDAFVGTGNPLDYDTVAAGSSRRWGFVQIPVEAGTKYIASGLAAQGGVNSAFFGDTPSDIISVFLNANTNRGYTAPEGAKYIGLCINVGYTEQPAITNPKAQFEEGETASPFAPYANICPLEGYNIWDPLTEQMIPVYSGYVDAEARKLYLHPVYEEYAGEELVGPWMSSMDEYTEEGTPTEGAFVVDMGGDVNEYDITDFMLQTLLGSLGVRRFIKSGAMLLNSLMDQAQGRVRSEEELINLSLPIHVIAIGKELPTNLVIKKPVSDVLPVLPGKI